MGMVSNGFLSILNRFYFLYAEKQIICSTFYLSFCWYESMRVRSVFLPFSFPIETPTPKFDYKCCSELTTLFFITSLHTLVISGQFSLSIICAIFLFF